MKGIRNYYCTPSVKCDIRIPLNVCLSVDGLGKLHRKELHNLYLSPGIIVVIRSSMRGVRHVTRTGEMRNAYKTLVRKPEGEGETIRRYRRIWEDNIILKCILKK